MGPVRLAALCTVMVAPGEAVAPGSVFEVKTEAEAFRLEEIGAAEILPEAAADEDPN